MEKLPDDMVMRIMWYLDTEMLFECAKVCKKWNKLLEPGDTKIWKYKYLPIENHVDMFEYINSDLVKNVLPHDKARIKALMCTWNEEDCSETLYLEEDLITVHRNPIAKSTDSIRSKSRFLYGRHHFVFVFDGSKFGSHAMIGVCTDKAPLRIRSYDNMHGITPHAWGWDVVNNVLLHNNEEYGRINGEKPKVEDRLGMTLDLDKGTLHFYINGEKKTEHFNNLPNNERLYPTMCSVYGNSAMSMVYYGKPPS